MPINDLYRKLYNPEFYLHAYARLYTNDGAMTPGSTDETVDAMSLTKIRQLIDDVRHERHRWAPARRKYIPKKNGKKRPLGIATWKDKLLQEVIRMLLEALFEALYEPQFSTHSHGFRPQRGCHTAFNEIVTTWTGDRWFLEGDISKCFERIDHQTLLSILRRKIHDNRFLRLIQNLLQAGYLEDWRYNETLSGTPQGGPLSPLLANIYMNELDQYVEQVLLPKYTRGEGRRRNKDYQRLSHAAVRRKKQGRLDEAKELRKLAQRLPSLDPSDPDFRRLHYVRYADDILLGFAGPKAEVEAIKQELGAFLRDHLKLELSQEKTLITHAKTKTALFLGYEIVVLHANDKHDRHGRRSINSKIELRLPAQVVEKKRTLYQKKGKPIHRPGLIHDDDFSIVSQYQSEYRGLVQYYLLATNVSWLNRLHWTMKSSLLKTLAAKHKTRSSVMRCKYTRTIETPSGSMKCLEVVVPRAGKKPLVARFGGIPLRRQKVAILKDQAPIYVMMKRNELLKRLLADTCELCGSTENVEVHHVRKLADLNKKEQKEKPAWMHVMAARRRKTLITCHECHHAIHAGKPTR
nr:reverse transcriptase/maturase family protein [Ktedonobacter robiniae]